MEGILAQDRLHIKENFGDSDMGYTEEELDQVIEIRAQAWKNYFILSELDLEHKNSLLNLRPI